MDLRISQAYEQSIKDPGSLPVLATHSMYHIHAQAGLPLGCNMATSGNWGKGLHCELGKPFP